MRFSVSVALLPPGRPSGMLWLIYTSTVTPRPRRTRRLLRRPRFQVKHFESKYYIRNRLTCVGADEATAEPGFGGNADWEVAGAGAGAFAAASATAGAASANWDAAGTAGEDWAAAPGGSTEWGAATATTEQQW